MKKQQRYINLLAFGIFISLIMFIVGVKQIFYLIPATIVVISIIFKEAGSATLFVWLKFSHVLGVINTSIILFLIYFCLITPYSLLFKKWIRGNYILRKPSDAISLFRERNHKVLKSDFEKSW